MNDELLPVPSQDHCGYQLSGGVIPILPYVLWTLICSVIVLYTLSFNQTFIYVKFSYYQFLVTIIVQ